MRFFKVLTTIFIATLFVACNFTEEIYFNEDGTGNMSISFDGGEMIQMLPSTDSKKDSISQLSAEEQAKLKRLEPFSLHMKVEPESGIMNFDMYTDFKEVSEVNDAFNAFQHASSVGPIAGGQSMSENATEETTKVNYSFKKNKFKRETVILNQELFDKTIDSLAGSEMFLSSSTYTFKYHFPKRIKSTNIEEATFSMDGKTMIHEVNFLEMMKDPKSILIEVELGK